MPSVWSTPITAPTSPIICSSSWKKHRTKWSVTVAAWVWVWPVWAPNAPMFTNSWSSTCTKMMQWRARQPVWLWASPCLAPTHNRPLKTWSRTLKRPSTRRSCGGWLWASHSPCMADWKKLTLSSTFYPRIRIRSCGELPCTRWHWLIAELETTKPCASSCTSP